MSDIRTSYHRIARLRALERVPQRILERATRVRPGRVRPTAARHRAIAVVPVTASPLPRTMLRFLHPLRIAVRVLATLLLVVGILIWTGRVDPWRSLHQSLGGLLALALLGVGIAGTQATRRAGPLVMAILWAVLLMGYGIAHARLWPGDMHWVAQALHVLIGLATVGMAEGMAARAARATGTATATP